MCLSMKQSKCAFIDTLKPLEMFRITVSVQFAVAVAAQIACTGL